MDKPLHITKIRANPLVNEALDTLRAKLAKDLLYHGYAHTEDVLNEVVRLAVIDNLSDREIELLAIAAAWHDLGFIWSRHNNESLAAEALKRSLAKLSLYTVDETHLMAQMILDTALIPDGETFKQVASHKLSCYLLDADLANFGRDDFFEKSELQRRELGEDLASFRIKTLALIGNHKWLTKAAKDLWEEKKAENLEVLKRQGLS